jgi:hypothetical protein
MLDRSVVLTVRGEPDGKGGGGCAGVGGLATSAFTLIDFFQGNPVTSALGPLGRTATRGVQGKGEGLILRGLENAPVDMRTIAFGCHGREGRLALV